MAEDWYLVNTVGSVLAGNKYRKGNVIQKAWVGFLAKPQFNHVLTVDEKCYLWSDLMFCELRVCGVCLLRKRQKNRKFHEAINTSFIS